MQALPWAPRGWIPVEAKTNPLELARITAKATASDPFGLAEVLDATISLCALPPTLWGAAVGERGVVLNEHLAPPRRRFALAHELAHVMVRVGLAEIPWEGDEEFIRPADNIIVLSEWR